MRATGGLTLTGKNDTGTPTPRGKPENLQGDTGSHGFGGGNLFIPECIAVKN